MSVSTGARIFHVGVLGGLLVLALFFPYLWFGVTPFGSDAEFSDAEIAALLEGKDIADYYAQPLPDVSMEELAQQKANFTWCRFCHTLGLGGHNRVGPNLHSIFGQPAAVVDHFAYSDAFIELRESGHVWTPENMLGFIQAPHEFVPGNRMRYPPMIGYEMSPERDASIIAYLLRMTAPGAPSDETIPTLAPEN
jgi:cytochrome c2